MARSTYAVGFKRKVKTNGHMKNMTIGQKDAYNEARLEGFLKSVERESIRVHPPRKLRFIGRRGTVGFEGLTKKAA